MLHSAESRRTCRRTIEVTAAVAMALLLSACAGPNWSVPSLDLSSVGGGSKPPETGAPVTAAQTETSVASASPGQINPELAEARVLRRAGDKTKALAVIEQAIAKTASPDRALLAEGGLLALDLGAPDRAEAMLRKADDPAKPDWRIQSGLGITASAQGRHEEARRHFKTALALSPGQPSVLNNLALSHVLEKKTSEAEKVLKEAAKAAPKSARIKQNLALAQGLKGRGDETGEAESPTAPAKAAPSRKVTAVSPAPYPAPLSTSTAENAGAATVAMALPKEQPTQQAPRERLAQSGGPGEMTAGQ